MIKLNIGCASRPLNGYINIDMDSIEDIKKRYPNLKIAENIEIFNYDIFNLPFFTSSLIFTPSISVASNIATMLSP